MNRMRGFDEMNEDQEYDYEESDIEYYAERPNKTRIKKEFALMFDLGEELSALSREQLNDFDIPEALRNALMEVSGMPHKGARKRLLKYIAGQLHKLECGLILEQLARIKNQSAHGIREHHMAERWRDKLIQNGSEAITELLFELPKADSQHLRQLVRNAKKEAETLRPPKSSRMLYRYLKELLGSSEDEIIEK